MKLKTEEEIEVAANKASEDWHPCLKDIDPDKYFEIIEAFYQGAKWMEQDLLSQASEGFEEWKAHNLSCHESVRIHDLCERSYQAAKLSQAKELKELKKENEELKEEVRFLKASNAKLDEARICHLEQNEKLQKENEELRKIVSWCRYQLLPYSDYKPDCEKFHEMTKELFKGEAK